MSYIDYEINKELGECYLFMGEFDKARDYYQKAVACNDAVAEPYIGLAAVSLSLGDLSGAYSLYRKAHDVEPGFKSLTGMAMIEVELGQHDDAFEHYAAALSHNPGNMLVVNNLLQLAHGTGRLEDMLPHLEAALEPGDTEAVRYALAGCLTALGRDDDAKKHLEILLGENPANGVAQQLYAHFAA